MKIKKRVLEMLMIIFVDLNVVVIFGIVMRIVVERIGVMKL